MHRVVGTTNRQLLANRLFDALVDLSNRRSIWFFFDDQIRRSEPSKAQRVCSVGEFQRKRQI
jgi:hypothetical protein